MKQKFIEWFTKNNNGCSPAMEDDRSFVHEKTQHMFEAYQAGVAEGEARCAALVAENAGLKEWSPNPHSASMFEAIEKAEKLMDDGMPELAMVEAFEILKMQHTPATDAFLAEVRASGVEMFAQKCDLKAAQSLASDVSDNWKLLGLHASYFAAQLRKGVQS
ncbi:hypothetical protein DP185_16390 [Enterobacter hormaechei]|uniref:hypothetical protein n=1 Tax=Enterobacter quasihormaechei TaxID=2529382 RepID=UPI000DCF3E07|nr:hypothetical protein DP185_16390 [Enterobacter hormaechei]